MKKMEIRSIIVDDEPVARNIIKRFLKNDADIKIIGEAGNGQDAVKIIFEEKPDLVFLDIQMPEITGFDVIEQVGTENLPFIIFVTAYDEYTLKAFEINALDYLLKPFNKQRFENSINRAKDLIWSKKYIKRKIDSLLDDIGKQKKILNKILVKTGGRVLFLETRDIEWIEASAYYVKIYSKKGIYPFRETLTNLENKLDPDRFIRIHRSFIVNTDAIKEIKQEVNNNFVVILNDNTRLNLSRNYRQKLFKIFGAS